MLGLMLLSILDQKTNFPVQTPPFREEPGLGGVCAAPSKPLVRGGAVQAELSITNAPNYVGMLPAAKDVPLKVFVRQLGDCPSAAYRRSGNETNISEL